jgi:hypothetical protein
MDTKFNIPADRETTGVLSMLYGDGLVVKKAEENPSIENDALVGLFVDSEGKTVAACTCDVPFAAYGGAALSMMPKGGAEDAAESGEISTIMQENVYEVMNICSRLLMNDSTPHLKLTDMYEGLDKVPDEAVEVIKNANGVKFEVEIPNYGKGHLSIVTL